MLLNTDNGIDMACSTCGFGDGVGDGDGEGVWDGVGTGDGDGEGDGSDEWGDEGLMVDDGELTSIFTLLSIVNGLGALTNGVFLEVIADDCLDSRSFF